MKTLTLLFSFMIFFQISFSQELKVIQLPQQTRSPESTTVIDGVTTHTYSSGKKIPVNGSPFLNDRFEMGKIELVNGKSSDDIFLRYNIAQDAFEILQKEDTLTINRPYEIKTILLGERSFIFDPYLRKGEDRKFNGYFEVLTDGKLKIYKKFRKEMSFDSFAGNYQGGSGTKEYYYIDKNGIVAVPENNEPFLIRSAGSFLKEIGEHKSELKSFIKKERIKFNKEEDVVKLAEYYNQLN